MTGQPRVRRIALLSTGGTIEKTYNASEGTLSNARTVLDTMLATLVLNGVEVDRVGVMNKDSLDMVEADHERIAQAAEVYGRSHDGVVITHGTDRLEVTGETIERMLGAALAVPVILTGAMRPYELRETDAFQNLTEALLAAQILSPGVYVVMHSEVLRFPGVTKDHDQRRFVRRSP